MVYILMGAGFEETELITPLDLLRRADVKVMTVGIGGKRITGGHGITIGADITIEQMDLTAMDMIVLPGGLGGVATARSSKKAMEALKFAWENDKYVAAICAGPTVLADLGITDHRNVTCYPSCAEEMGSALVKDDVPCVTDGKLITAASAGCAASFGLALVAALKGETMANKVRQQIVIR